MKTIIKIVSVTLIMLLMMSTVSFAVTSYGYGDIITMYAPDGRQIDVSVYDVQNWKNVGWYDYPVITMYAPDGRQMVIYTGDVPSWKAVGWYDYPVTTMYAPDGRQMVIYTGDVAAWKAVGWYDYPVYTGGNNNSSNSGYNSIGSGVYYPGTNIPDYTAVTGVKLKDYYQGDEGVNIYIYPDTHYGEYSEIVDYIVYLTAVCGWKEFKEESEPGKITWYLVKGQNVIGVTYQAKFTEVWVMVGN